MFQSFFFLFPTYTVTIRAAKLLQHNSKEKRSVAHTIKISPLFGGIPLAPFTDCPRELWLHPAVF